jgi:hypothetical protein
MSVSPFRAHSFLLVSPHLALSCALSTLPCLLQVPVIVFLTLFVVLLSFFQPLAAMALIELALLIFLLILPSILLADSSFPVHSSSFTGWPLLSSSFLNPLIIWSHFHIFDPVVVSFHILLG